MFGSVTLSRNVFLINSLKKGPAFACQSLFVGSKHDNVSQCCRIWSKSAIYDIIFFPSLFPTSKHTASIPLVRSRSVRILLQCGVKNRYNAENFKKIRTLVNFVPHYNNKLVRFFRTVRFCLPLKTALGKYSLYMLCNILSILFKFALDYCLFFSLSLLNKL